MPGRKYKKGYSRFHLMHLRQLYLPASSSKLQKYHQFLCNYAQVVHSETKTQAGVMIAKNVFIFNFTVC